MPNILDVFRTDAFGFRAMVARFENIPYVPGQALSLPIWEEEGITTPHAYVEQRDTVLALIPTSPRGAAGKQIQDAKRKVHSLEVPHLQQNSTVFPEEVSGVREFGSTDQFQTVESVVNRRLALGGQNFDATTERLAVAALQGITVDAVNTSLELANMYTILGVSKPTLVTLPITASNGDASGNGDGSIKAMLDTLVNAMADALLLGAIVPQVHVLASVGFMAALCNADEVRSAYQRYTDASTVGTVGAYLRDGRVQYGKPPFQYGGVSFELYRGPGITANRAIAIPILPAGVPKIFKIAYAPADYNETVNTVGRPRYAKVANDPLHNKWTDIEMQTNPLPFSLRPAALFDLAFS